MLLPLLDVGRLEEDEAAHDAGAMRAVLVECAIPEFLHDRLGGYQMKKMRRIGIGRERGNAKKNVGIEGINLLRCFSRSLEDGKTLLEPTIRGLGHGASPFAEGESGEDGEARLIWGDDNSEEGRLTGRAVL